MMYQVNFRVNEDEKFILEKIAEEKHISIAELTLQYVRNELKPNRIDFAFDLLNDDKIGKKKAWKLSGLSYHEFMIEWAKRGAHKLLPENLMDEAINNLQNLDLNKHRKKFQI